MTTMEGLGRVFNVQYLMSGLWVNMKYCSSVAFVCYIAAGAGDTYTLQEATTAAGGGAQNLVTVTRYFTNTGNGTDAWTLRTQAAAATVVAAAAATQNCTVFHVDGTELTDGFDYLRVTATGAGVIIPVTYDLTVQRTPANLPAMAA